MASEACRHRGALPGVTPWGTVAITETNAVGGAFDRRWNEDIDPEREAKAISSK